MAAEDRGGGGPRWLSAESAEGQSEGGSWWQRTEMKEDRVSGGLSSLSAEVADVRGDGGPRW